LILFLVLVIQTSAQREQGSWKDYLSYSNATKVAISAEKVYCATEGGLFYFDLQDNSVNKLSEILTLSDFGIKTIAYNTENDVLIIAYNNSNVDLVYGNGTVINLPDIKNKFMSSNKSINAISFLNDEAYLACGFGIIVLNLSKNEVKDTYYIGEDGADVDVQDIAFLGQDIYAATVTGVLSASTNGTNLLDYNNWNPVTDIPHATAKFNHLEVHAGKLIANYTPDEWYADEMYILNEGGWEPYLPQIKFAFDMHTNGNYLTIASRSDVFVIDETNNIIGQINSYPFENEQVSSIKPRSASISTDGSIWIADFEKVLVRVKGDSFEKIFPSGPQDNKVFKLSQSSSDLWIAPGGIIGWEPPRFQRYRNGQWTYFSKSGFPELDGFNNIVDIEIDPTDENHFFVASWGGGLLEYRNDEFVQRYTNHNSPLETALPQNPDEPYVRINGLDFDQEGNLWMTNSEVAHNAHKLSPTGEWESFVLEKAANKYNLGDLIVTEAGDKWMLVSNHDAYVINKTGDQIKQLLVTSYFSNGSDQYFTRMNDVYSIAEDLDGAIWIGTSKGVAVYSSPSRIWTADNFYASQPGLDLNDGIYHPLLETETVTAIAVDGANRKWLGTRNAGVFLVPESGEKEILHFTSENSPLLSNNIMAITINQKNGEVFFGTDKGLNSYQGEATGGSKTYSNVYVYPNPVRETYDGPVTIAGLIENTDIKVTDISGNLVFKTTSLGGQAVWDGKNLNGNRVKTGVYLVFCNDENGEETHITKLLFIN